MGSYTRTYSLTNGTVAYGDQVVYELDAIASSVNNIVNAQISSGAGVADSKLATISTPGKVSGTAITGLASVPSGAGVLPSANGGCTAATSAEVKTGTEAAKYVAPSTMIGHEGVIKGWVVFNGTGTVDTTPDYKYNVSGIVDNGTGDYTITWDTDFGSANYACVATAGAGTGTQLFAWCTTFAAGSVNVLNADHNGSPRDSNPVSVIAIGDR